MPCGTDREKARAALLQGYAIVRTTITSSGPQLNDYDAHRVLFAGEALLDAYKVLTWQAAMQEQARWPLKPKHHHWHEGLRTCVATRRNPQSHWLPKHEHFVGIVAKIASKAHPATCSRRALERWALKIAVRNAPPVKAPLAPRAKKARFYRFRVRGVCFTKKY